MIEPPFFILFSHKMATLEYQRLYTDFLSEGLIFAYQQPHYRINENQ